MRNFKAYQEIKGTMDFFVFLIWGVFVVAFYGFFSYLLSLILQFKEWKAKNEVNNVDEIYMDLNK